MNDSYRRPGRLKLLYFAVLIFYGSTYSWSSGEGTGIINENQNSPVEENTIYATSEEKVLSLSAKTASNQDESDPSTRDQGLNQSVPRVSEQTQSQTNKTTGNISFFKCFPTGYRDIG